jgi:hypothetical protein
MLSQRNDTGPCFPKKWSSCTATQNQPQTQLRQKPRLARRAGFFEDFLYVKRDGAVVSSVKPLNARGGSRKQVAESGNRSSHVKPNR